MRVSSQERIIAELEEKFSGLIAILEETIIKHSDAAYDLKDLKVSLEDLCVEKFDNNPEKLLVTASECEESIVRDEQEQG
mgnify:CR=1 FL=1